MQRVTQITSCTRQRGQGIDASAPEELVRFMPRADRRGPDEPSGVREGQQAVRDAPRRPRSRTQNEVAGSLFHPADEERYAPLREETPGSRLTTRDGARP